MLLRRPIFASMFALALALGSIAQAQTFKVDPTHSSVIFRAKHVNVGYTYGRFNDVKGQVAIDANDPAKSSFELTIAAASIDSANAKRDEHLKGNDFFNVKEFPSITFKSTSVKKSDKGYEVTGDLTLHGKTKSIVVNIEKTGEGDTPFKDYRLGLEATVELKRSDFGMATMPQAVGDDVRLIIALETVKQ